MRFLKVPNVPDGRVADVLIDGRISLCCESTLTSMGIRLIKTRPYDGVYHAICGHPDVMFHHVDCESIVYAKGISLSLLEELTRLGFNMIKGETALGSVYPYNIGYNVARVGSLAFHNLKYTDYILKKELDKRGIKMIHVNQGYAKCSVAVIDEKSIITADMGIAKAAGKNGIDVLLIPQNEKIMLPGLDRGFIGGSSGMIDKNKWAIAGNLERLSCAGDILAFLNKRDIEVISLSDEEVTDVGSFIPLTVI